MVKPTISTVMTQSVSKASYLYISRIKQTKKSTEYEISYADIRVSQIPSANMAFGIEL